MHQPRLFFDMNLRQWGVIGAAWLGWGFDVFDALLFNYVSTNCITTLLGLELGTPESKQASIYWTGVASSVLLIFAAIGGVLFGRVADRFGRSRTMLLTMGLYAVATALCAVAPNLGTLLVLRAVAALGIGGEWAAGAAMVAEVVPEKRRVQAGALLYTAAPIGLFLATGVNALIAGHWLKGDPSTSWRWVFAAGILPALVALLLRLGLREPERWHAVATVPARFAELFSPEVRRQTLSGLAMALTGMLMWWGCNAFIPLIAGGLGDAQAVAAGLSGGDRQAMVEGTKTTATNLFNLGGLIGTLITVPIAQVLGRRPMYAAYFLLSAVCIYASFGMEWTPAVRTYLYFPIGLTVFGVFGSFTYYLPELFPTRLRATGAGFCYNSGRVFASVGPFVVGAIASQGKDAFASAMVVMSWIAIVPLLGMFALPWAVETRGQALAD
jgi:MFS family permease